MFGIGRCEEVTISMFLVQRCKKHEPQMKGCVVEQKVCVCFAWLRRSSRKWHAISRAWHQLNIVRCRISGSIAGLGVWTDCM